jgi:prevent-host-death family protein
VTRQLTATEAKATLLALLDEVAAGDQIEITKHGHTVARLVPASGPRSLKGRLTGMARTGCSEEELFSTGEAWDAS